VAVRAESFSTALLLASFRGKNRRDIVGEPGQIGEQWKLRIRRRR